jgi:long-chain acyl-CoA synthetase
MELLGRMLRNLLLRPHCIVVVDDHRCWRGYELYLAALHLAREIERTTTRPHVGLMLPTSGLTPVGILATWMLGRTIVPINYLLRPADRDYVIENAELDAVVTVTPMIEHVGDLPPQVRQIRLDRLSFHGFPPLRRPVPRSDEHLAALVYTSGTSGRPKGVMLTAGNLTTNVRQCVEWAGLPRQTVVLGVLPQFHCFGLTVLTLLPLWLGAKVVYTSRFVPGKVLKLLLEHRPHIFLAIPSMLNSLLNAKGATREHFSSVSYLVSGGEPLPQSVFDGFRERFGVTLNEGYGLTETSPVANWCRPRDHKRWSVGPPLPGVQEKIVSLDGTRLGVDEEGEVRIKGPNLTKGYYKHDVETAAAFDEEGYLRTGDIGRIDADGHLYITGRLKEMLVIGGENVSPRAIEDILDRYPGVLSSAVIGVPDPGRGEVPVAFVELDPEVTFDEPRLRAHCREHLAPYQVPRRVICVERMPRSPIGKILRRELRELLDGQDAQA